MRMPPVGFQDLASVTTHRQLVKYLFVGGINTVIATSIIFAAQALSAPPVIANVIGYGAGILISFLLNSTFTFRSPASGAAMLRFLVVAGVCWLLNLGTMLAALQLTGHAYAAQLCGVAVYTLAGFAGNKLWAFRRVETNET
ncbi:Putative flippase GtrA (transmembrane translocase of bactoprenol-linked glucose) [Paraburkholderia lycopersici]|uniref:Putative flippase GtrA (Transmembrane translocase of bactoprenol-linked glucose) n=2 Tax=Paraburkholderia lycopersici TaxID=416944 RepID=A0A1G6NFT0_9BURK|nr:Putative flippase GtrA (transmembrane translocase of bactoprenol-linked glucose) [Paraburkholderia lycopersici]